MRFLILVFAVAQLCITSVANAGPPSAPPVPVLNWGPCVEDVPGAQCATAVVPLDYNQPHGSKISLALARIPAADEANRIGTVFINPGGPGASGVDVILYYFDWANDLANLLKGRFDVVSFDPRGVARSEPVYCFDTMSEEDAFLESVIWFPWRKDQERGLFEAWQYFTAQCLGHKQRILPHLSTAHFARDLDLLRQAVGDKGLTYIGFSNGTYLGQTYANLFPESIRAMVIDGVIDPQAYSTGWFILYSRVSNDKEFNELLRLCDAAGQKEDGSYNCSLSGPEGAVARWNTLKDMIRSAPFPPGFVFPDGSAMAYDDLIWDANNALYDPVYWVDYADYFAGLLDFALGDSAAGVRAAELRRGIQAGLKGVAAKQELYPNFWDVYTAITCADTEYPRLFAEWSLIGNLAAYHSTFGPNWWWPLNPACATWPANKDRYAGPWRVRTSAPVLVVGNYFDGITDYSGAVVASKLLKNSRLLSYAGWGHTAFFQTNITDCVKDLIGLYLLEGTLPPIGKVCPAPPNPFLPTPAILKSVPARKSLVRPPPRPFKR